MSLDDMSAELLSAHLDGELDGDERRRVEQLLAESPEARAELEALADARARLRDLAAVDPPFGFYERMLRAGSIEGAGERRRAPRWGGWAVAAAAAMLLVAVGIVPVEDDADPAMVPAMDEFAARHEQVALSPVAAISEPEDAPGEAMVAVEPAEAVAGPAQVADWDRSSAYAGSGDVVHLVYRNGEATLSVYHQPGQVE